LGRQCLESINHSLHIFREVGFMNEKAYQDALAFNPNVVVIKLGTNDSKSFNWKQYHH